MVWFKYHVKENSIFVIQKHLILFTKPFLFQIHLKTISNEIQLEQPIE